MKTNIDPIYITHLYPKEMSIYGDMGNILAFQYRLKQWGLDYVYQTVNLNESLPQKTDFYFLGGGQDADQLKVCIDLLSKKDILKNHLLSKKIPALLICGGYQLFGKQFITGTGEVIQGLDILPVETKALNTQVASRSIGNLLIKSLIEGLENIELLGFENHSGQTYFLDQTAEPLGSVIVGSGNNALEKLEGCVYKNIIGTYMHGSCLPKNPELTDWFIQKVLENLGLVNDYVKPELSKIALEAKNQIVKRII